MQTRILSLVVTLYAILGLAPVLGQSSELVMAADSSKLWIDGTSNKSDWTVTATDMSGSLVLDDSGRPVQATVRVVADRIESNTSKIMDRLMYRALKTNAHPTIEYTLTSVEQVDGSDSLATTGQIQVAGVTKEAPMQVEWVPADDGSYRVRGSHEMKMTEYGMKPPTAMFGALHTGDEVVVYFDVVFRPAEI